jgi:hypothetical protein
MVIRTLLLMALLFSLSVPAATQISAAVDKNPALLNESITLDVTLDTKADAAAIDFSELKSNFTVMMPSVSQSTRIINGKASQSTQWKVVLLAKKAGNFTIPAFTYQGLTTEPIALTILAAEAAATTATNNPELFLQSSIEQDQLYVQQLSYYKVQIFFNGELQRGALSEPSLDNAIIQQVGQDVEGSELVNGIRYRTISRRYAITPQQSGRFTISPPTFNGEMLDRDSRQYGYYSRSKKVVQQAQPIDITVQPIPSPFPTDTSDWLIAGLVTLSEEWSPNVTQLTVGEPITRTITLSAVDVAENQLPELMLNFPNSLRLYQEQPQAKSAERNGHIIAQKIFTTAVIATTTGEVTLPEVSLPWWNSKTNQLSTAVLAAKTFQVNPAANSSTPGSLPAVNSAATLNTTSDVNDRSLTAASLNQSVNNWAWTYSTTTLMVLWLITLLGLYLVWQHRFTQTKPQTSPTVAKFNSHNLKMACQNNDPEAAKQALLRWGHRYFNQPFMSLGQLTAYLTSAELIALIEQLNATLYGHPGVKDKLANNNISAKKQWQGQALWQQWQQYNPKSAKTNANSDLAPLYPNDVR